MGLRFWGPIEGRPFRSALNPVSSLYVDLGAVGYVEEEWFVTGEADSVGPTGEVLAAAQPFTTRLLVRRPSEGASGTVYLETLHPLDEDTAAWTNSRAYLTRARHTWVGLTTSTGVFSFDGRQGAGGIARLQREDADRYRALHLFDPGIRGPRVTLGPTGIEDSIVRAMSFIDTQGASIAAQVAAAIRSRARRIYAFGFSHTGNVWTRFLDQGGSGFDGYVIAVAPGPAVHPDEAVVVHMLSEGELVGTLRPPMAVAGDTDVPRFRGYEVPGSFHYWTMKAAKEEDHGARHDDQPWQLLFHAMLANLERWVDSGVPMPRAPRVARTETGLVRDADGNAVGGVRSPWLDVPDGRYFACCSCSPVIGVIESFPPDELARRYGRERPARLRRRAEELVAGRWLLAEDLAALDGTQR